MPGGKVISFQVLPLSEEYFIFWLFNSAVMLNHVKDIVMILSKPSSYWLFGLSLIGSLYLIVKSLGLFFPCFFTLCEDNTNCLCIFIYSHKKVFVNFVVLRFVYYVIFQ